MACDKGNTAQRRQHTKRNDNNNDFSIDTQSLPNDAERCDGNKGIFVFITNVLSFLFFVVLDSVYLSLPFGSFRGVFFSFFGREKSMSRSKIYISHKQNTTNCTDTRRYKKLNHISRMSTRARSRVRDWMRSQRQWGLAFEQIEPNPLLRCGSSKPKNVGHTHHGPLCSEPTKCIAQRNLNRQTYYLQWGCRWQYVAASGSRDFSSLCIALFGSFHIISCLCVCVSCECFI